MSKAALNMFTKTAANELRPLGIAVFAIHPGWVQTDMGGPSARLTPTEAAQTLLHTVNQLTLAESGHYLTENGQPIEW
ncbi:MAG: SDR family NAD(P)-dependent oxidoreductase [Chloroflexi bacterium]|nr:SDR family NAD(P)-dependent oxidoreductase [Chloroflexota bacterium]